MNIDNQFKLPSRKKISMYLGKILSVQQSPDIACASFPVARQYVGKSALTKKFKERCDEIVNLITQLESLLRWGWFHAKSISSCDLELDVDIESIPVSSSFIPKSNDSCKSESEQEYSSMLASLSLD